MRLPRWCTGWACAPSSCGAFDNDFMWPLWMVLDRTPEGGGKKWGSELDYSAKAT
jgi:hypothetical protein